MKHIYFLLWYPQHVACNCYVLVHCRLKTSSSKGKHSDGVWFWSGWCVHAFFQNLRSKTVLQIFTLELHSVTSFKLERSSLLKIQTRNPELYTAECILHSLCHLKKQKERKKKKEERRKSSSPWKKRKTFSPNPWFVQQPFLVLIKSDQNRGYFLQTRQKLWKDKWLFFKPSHLPKRRQ